MIKRVARRVHEGLLRRLLAMRRFDVSGFARFEAQGVHVLPIGYYSPLPHRSVLDRERERWNRARPLRGLRLDLGPQLAFLDSLAPFAEEALALPAQQEVHARGLGQGYGEIEAQCLYAALRRLRPRRVIEVGSGISTWFAVTALRRNRSEGAPEAHLTCIEPHPRPALEALAREEGVRLDLRVEEVQATPPGLFDELGEDDLLFVDSSHTVRVDGDVPFLLLEVLPRLRAGCLVHVHDVTLPYPAPPNDHPVFHMFYLWRETDLLHAFLLFNEAFRVELCQSQLHHERPDAIRAVFPSYDPARHFPSSTWLRRVAAQAAADAGRDPRRQAENRQNT